MEPAYSTLTLSLHRQGATLTLELEHTDPTSQARIAPVRGEAAFDLAALLEVQHQPEAYGKRLAAQLFHDPALVQRFAHVETAVQATGGWLRLSLRIDPSAQELHGLRWELLRHPTTGAALATSEHVLFSRFMVSTDWRPVRLRARAELRALIAVSAPPAEALARYELAPVDFEGEVTRIEAALGEVSTRTLGGPDHPLTLEALVAGLREGIDVLYVVSHGAFARSTGMPTLFLQDEGGGVAPVKGDVLAERVSELQSGPRLVVLASCQSAGRGDDTDPEHRGHVQATLAGRLADAGVPAVVAMQGFISMATVETMMPVFFQELLRDGQIDRALAAARGVVRGREDHWMPALFLRLTSGRIWYTPGFARGKGDDTWKRLILPVRQGKLVPILGPGVRESISGSSFELARKMAEKHGFPLAAYEWDDLPRVTQYISVKESRFNVVQEYQAQLTANLVALHRHSLPEESLQNPRLGPLLAQISRQLREADPDDPYRALAELPASVYVTTNFDPVLAGALTDAQRKPQRISSRWRYKRSPEQPGAPVGEVDAQSPLIFHALGAFGKDGDDTLVLTEDDYFEYLIATASDRLMPAVVESALVDNSLLFLGFRLTDWSFRVLFRLIMSLPGKERLKQYCHVAVQVDPDLHTMADIDGAKSYLAQYFDTEANIDIYWGTPREFLAQLRAELARTGGVAAAADEDDGDDDWDF